MASHVLAPASRGYVGTSPRRLEDPELLTGRSTFVGDISVPGMVHAVFLRSAHAHARLLRLDADRARALPGVLAVLEGGEAQAALGRMPESSPHPNLKPFTQYAMAGEVARYVGEPLAVVLAENRYVAEDAIDLIEVDYEPLPTCVDIERALEPGAVLVHPEAGDNVAGWMRQSVGDVDDAFRHAPHVFQERFHVTRGGGHPIETRNVAASFERGRGELTVWATTQGAHRLQRLLCAKLGLPEHRVRVITPSVGGGFGTKGGADPEALIVAWAAMRTGRPVKWMEDRREHALAARQERDQVHRVEMAVDDRGVILGLRDRFLHDAGAYTNGMIVPWITSTTIPGPYRVPNYSVEFQVVFTHRVPTIVVRGAGRPQAVQVMEAMLDRVARELGLDRAEVRRRNMIRPEEQPYDVGLTFRDNRPQIYDGGDYPACFARAIEMIDYDDFEDYRRRAAAEGRRVGLGMACAIEGTGLGPYEGATVRIELSGRVVVFTGATPSGQGHHTTLSQICADALGARLDEVHVVTADTATIPKGIGTFGSRSTVNAGNAVFLAAGRLREKVVALASAVWECPTGDLRLEEGRVVAPDGRAMTLGEAARTAAGVHFGYALEAGAEPSLEATAYFSPDRATYTFSAQAVVAEVDPATGFCRLERFVMVHDCGRVINPTIVHGQAVGGVAHGIGNALFEEVLYDERGQVLNGSFMEYLLPGACEVPRVEVDHMETPSPLNPLGVKGAGESGTIPAPAAIVGAIEDALAPEGVRVRSLPVSPERLFALVRQGRTSP